MTLTRDEKDGLHAILEHLEDEEYNKVTRTGETPQEILTDIIEGRR